MEESLRCLPGNIIIFLTGYIPIQKKSLIKKKKKRLHKMFLCRTWYYQSHQVAGPGQEKTRNFWGRVYKRFQGSITDLRKWSNRGH